MPSETIERLRPRLADVLVRNQQLQDELADPAVMQDMDRYRKLSKEYADNNAVSACYRQYQKVESQLIEAKKMASDNDADIAQMAKEEAESAELDLIRLENELKVLLLPKDPDDDCNIFLEIRAGTGGDESGLFAGDLFRMYHRFVERKGWTLEIISMSEAEKGGYKEIICRIEGESVYGILKFESGGHRVQRVPETEAQGRIHTSACTVAVMPEVVESSIQINPADLRIDTFRASGAGGQHVNKTDSAIRITHIPTGLVVECQDDRSQHRNRARALGVLAARLKEKQRDEQQKKTASERKLLVGSGDRSERIRTYNFPQGRLTDHRINLTLYKLAFIMDGDLEDLIQAMRLHHQSELLAESLEINS